MRPIVTLALLITAGVLVLTGCAADQAASRRSTFVDEHPSLSETMAEAILNGQIMVGMSEEMVKVSWGSPARVASVTDDEEDAKVQWIYGNYFVGGNITNLYFSDSGTLLRYEVNYQPAHANAGTVNSTDDVTKGTLSGNDVLLSKESGGRP
jgi:hypothetical protein